MPLVDNGKLENKNQYEFLINYLNDLKYFFIEKNIFILFESDFEPIQLKEFIERFPENTFGINYDIGNSAHYSMQITNLSYMEKEFLIFI